MSFKVKALRRGYIGLRRVQEGQVISVSAEEFSPKWMESEDPKLLQAHEAIAEKRAAARLEKKQAKEGVDVAKRIAALEAELVALKAKAAEHEPKGKKAVKAVEPSVSEGPEVEGAPAGEPAEAKPQGKGGKK